MPAPEGNKYGFGTDETGRPREWDSPEQLQEAIDAYFNYCDVNPLIKIEYNGKDAARCEVPIQRPYTVEGLAIHLGVDRKTLLNYQKKAGYEAFFPVITRAKQKIVDQQITFGMAGGYNHNVVRLVLTNNSDYKDQKAIDHTTAGESLNDGDLSNLSDEELLQWHALNKKRSGNVE